MALYLNVKNLNDMDHPHPKKQENLNFYLTLAALF